MKKLVKYQCEICSCEYLTESEALECEAKGKEKPLANLYDTVSFRDDWNGGFGTHWYDLEIVSINDSSHKVTYELGIHHTDEEFEYSSSEEYIYGNDDFINKCKLKC